MTRRGLRWKFNLFLLPVVAASVAVLGWLDSRYERGALVAAHAMHAHDVTIETTTAPVEGAISPEAVARRTLVMHALYAAGLLMLIGLGVNAALSRFVLEPIDRIRDGIEKMERGHWRMPWRPATTDEVGRVVESFQLLGLRVDAIVQQLLRAERLATLALVARRTSTQIEPRVARIAVAASDLHKVRDPAAREAALAITTASAEILAAVKGLDQLFDASLHLANPHSSSATRANNHHQLVEAAPSDPPVECGAGGP